MPIRARTPAHLSPSATRRTDQNPKVMHPKAPDGEPTFDSRASTPSFALWKPALGGKRLSARGKPCQDADDPGSNTTDHDAEVQSVRLLASGLWDANEVPWATTAIPYWFK